MEKVLFIEDSPIVQKILKHLTQLLRGGMEPVYASSYEQAKQKVEKYKGQLFACLADLSLPDAPNGEVVDMLLKEHIPTIVLTGTFNEEVQGKLLEKGVVDYVLKETRTSYEYAINQLNRLIENKGTKVIVAEDSRPALNHVKRLLQLHLFQVFCATNGVEALEHLEKNPDVELVITDFNMPEMDGFKLVQNIRQKYERNDLMILGLSANDQKGLSARFIKNGADDFLAKPFSSEEFNCRVMRILDSLKMMKRLEKAAYQDFLTKIPNRRWIYEKAEVFYKTAKNKNANLAVALIDIDHFKSINDRYGHEAGDLILEFFAGELEQEFSRYLYARTGGEEFMLILPGVDNGTAFEKLDSFRRQIAMQYIDYHGEEISFSFTAGVTNQLSESLSVQIGIADSMLIQGKHSGRNMVITD